LLEVATLVTRATEGLEPDVTIAALLHDAVEDQGISSEQIADQFGRKVASIVAEVTDEKSLLKAETKATASRNSGQEKPGSQTG
jgi:(p)ppGpp synthase/HD superfamily hydrolase